MASASIQVDVERPDVPAQLSASDPGLALESVGEQVHLTILASFTDGSTIDVTHSTLLSYASSNTALATVDASGTVTAVAAGNTSVVATYTISGQSLQISIPVTVSHPKLAVSPASLTFGSQSAGTSSPTQQLTLSNASPDNLSVLALTATGDFSETDNCVASSPLGSSGTCTANVTFSPAAAGARAGTLSIANSANIVPVSIPLSGTGTTAPAITGLNPNSGSVGTTVTITGVNFGGSQGTSTVTFNGATASPTSWSATSIVAPVPTGATTGNVVVTVSGQASNGVNFTVTNRPIAYVQGNSGSSTSQVASQSVPYTAAQTAGNLNVVVVGWSSSTVQVQSITDTAGNAYSLAVGPTVLSVIGSQAIYYAKNIRGAAANANSVTVKFTSSVLPDIRILEYSGLDTASPLDVSAAQTGRGVNDSSGSATTTSAPDLLVGAAFTNNGPVSPGTAYTSRILTGGSDDIVEDEVVASSGAYSATASAPNNFQCGTEVHNCFDIMQMVAFRSPH